MQDCQTTQNMLQSIRVRKTVFVSVLADLDAKHRRVASDDWYSLGVALFLFLVCISFEMCFIDDNHQCLCFGIVVGDELFRLGQEVDAAGSGEVLHEVLCSDADPVILDAASKLVDRRGCVLSLGADANGVSLWVITDDYLRRGAKGLDGTLVECNAERTQSHDGTTVLQIGEIEIVGHVDRLQINAEIPTICIIAQMQEKSNRSKILNTQQIIRNKMRHASSARPAEMGGAFRMLVG